MATALQSVTLKGQWKAFRMKHNWEETEILATILTKGLAGKYFECVAPECPPPFPVAQSVGGGGVDVRSRSFVRSLSSPRQPKRLGGTSRNVVVFFFVPLRHT